MSSPFVAILGGSFDPIHNGHLELAEIVSQHIKNTEIYFVPCGNPVHRAPSIVSANNRIAMIQSAIADQTHWHLDTYEIDNPEPSYTIKTLKYFRQRFLNHPIGFIMGMDTFLSLHTWGDWQELLNYAHLLVVPRIGHDVSSMEHLIKNENLLHKTLNGGIIMLPVAPQSVSSTEIRKKLLTRDDVSSLIPKAVYDYIQSQNLYL